MTNHCRGGGLSPFCLGTEIRLSLIEEKYVFGGFCVVVGFKSTPQMGTFKARVGTRNRISLLYEGS